MLLKGTRLLTAGSELEYEEYCHWTFPDDDPAAADGEPSYMMARRLKPKAERTAPAPASVLARTAALLVDTRPPVQPSGSRAAFILKLTPPAAAASPASASADGGATALAPPPPLPELYNRVVRIAGEDAYRYWYVLTFLPDLQWCHAAPLTQRGVFEAPSPSAGRCVTA